MKKSYVEGDPRSLTLLEKNARYMTHEQYDRLVQNVRRDGALTSVPLVYAGDDQLLVLSGNHRVRAAIDAGLDEIGWLQVDEPLTRQQQVALQLSHNAIAGQDDPATLRELYDELDDVDWRQYSGLDDKTLELLAKVDVSSLSEANLDYASVLLLFLPGELDRAHAALEEARKASDVDERWLAATSQYEPTLAALDTARDAFGIGNTATAFTVILDVFEAHLTDLQAGWIDRADEKQWIPVETLAGRSMPADSAAVVAQAIEKLCKEHDLDQPWRALELLAADYLSGA